LQKVVFVNASSASCGFAGIDVTPDDSLCGAPHSPANFSPPGSFYRDDVPLCFPPIAPDSKK